VENDVHRLLADQQGLVTSGDVGVAVARAADAYFVGQSAKGTMKPSPAKSPTRPLDKKKSPMSR
jgi:hypothetical protein